MKRKTAVFIAFALSAAAGCRLIAGYQDVTLASDAGDAGAVDASSGDAGCLVTSPTQLFSTPNAIEQLIVQGTTLYTIYDAPNGDEAVLACDPNACTAPTTVITATQTIAYSAAGPPLVFSVEGDDTQDDAGNNVPLDDGQILAQSTTADGGIAPVTSSLAFPYALAVDGQNLYFTDDPEYNAEDPAVGIATVRKCAFPNCASPQPWMTGFYTTYQLGVGATRVFVLADSDVSQTSTAVYSCDKNTACGTKPTRLVASDQALGSFTTLGDSVFATSGNAKAIVRADPDGGTTTLATGQDTPTSVVVDSTYVYWTALTDDTNGIGDVRRARIDGTGGVDRVLCGVSFGAQSTPPFLAGDATHLYVVEAPPTSNYAVVRVDKPQ